MSGTLRRLRSPTADDGPARLLALAVRALPADRNEWGRAMSAELVGVRGRRARWRFCLGCSRATARLRLRASFCAGDRGGAGVRGVVLAGVLAALALAVYGVVRYPDLRAGTRAWGSGVFLVVLLLGYAAAGLTLSRGSEPLMAAARRYGLSGGLLVGAAWLVVLAPGELLKGVVIVPLAVALLAPVGVAVLAGRASRDHRTATHAAVWSGLVGGLLVFAVWVTVTYARDGRPYDPQLLRDFHRSGARDLAAYAVSDNLGVALSMLVMIPTVALAFGSLAGRVAGRPPRAGRSD